MIKYCVASANEYLLKTGLLVNDIEITKKCFQFPGQVVTRITITPKNYTFELYAMTAEKLAFLLPVSFNIGPKEDKQSLNKFARMMGTSNEQALDTLITGIIKGETRTISSAMHVEEIFGDRKRFKDLVLEHIQQELDHFGLHIYNANIKELKDTEGSEYFKYMAMKTTEGVVNQSRVDVAASRTKAAIQVKERECEQRKAQARIEADAVVFEQARQQSMAESKAQLEVEKTEFELQQRIAVIQAQNQAMMREAELEKQLAIKRAALLEERQRADQLSKAIVEAERIKTLSEASSYQVRTEAEAKLYTEQQKVKSIKAQFDAQSDGIQRLDDALQGDNKAILRYIMLEKNVYPKLAQNNAQAIQGLDPQLVVWSS
ncbi:hypothetical protein EDD86DRAFT_189264 [Gorgonomyces haynaldii]|nr:hypothetical protein EDD86DRAFT_189264 [Gorgonomyces haynaldii]